MQGSGEKEAKISKLQSQSYLSGLGKVHLSSTRQIIDVTHRSELLPLVCCQCGSPELVEISLLGARPSSNENAPGIFEPFGRFEAQISFISGVSRKLKAVKLSLLVKVEVLDLSRQVIEKSESPFLSIVKRKPF